MRALNDFATAGVRPHRTLLLALEPELARARLAGEGRPPDRLEHEPGAFFAEIASAYELLAEAEPDRFRVLDASDAAPGRAVGGAGRSRRSALSTRLACVGVTALRSLAAALAAGALTLSPAGALAAAGTTPTTPARVRGRRRRVGPGVDHDRDDDGEHPGGPAHSDAHARRERHGAARCEHGADRADRRREHPAAGDDDPHHACRRHPGAEHGAATAPGATTPATPAPPPPPRRLRRAAAASPAGRSSPPRSAR